VELRNSIEIYLLKGETLIDYITKNTRKSIDFEYLKNNSYKIKESYTPRLKYLDAVDEAYFKEML